MGKKTMQKIGLDILNSSNSFSWGGIQVFMVPKNQWDKSRIGKFIEKIKVDTQDRAEVMRLSKHEEEVYTLKMILKSKYKRVDADAITEQQTHLTDVGRQVLSKLL